ncbi:hypothetical protein BJV82DRAFT_627209 [Fennellomyces sp. T-0311]|nr:hypothetical protein BJV82DRAFT_627209 [Fennellomyces sp. T-0311]
MCATESNQWRQKYYCTYETRYFVPKELKPSTRVGGEMLAKLATRPRPKLGVSSTTNTEGSIKSKQPLLSANPFRPSKLVQVETMIVVDGSEAKEGYSALSYTWSQSGDIQKVSDKKTIRNDRGLHKIIRYGTRQKSRGRKRHGGRVLETKYVDFERLVQHICKDFGIKYIWYDQMCMNGLKGDQKNHELRQMHAIYSHADWTVVLVPELRARTRGQRRTYIPTDTLTPNRTNRGLEFYRDARRISSTRGWLIHPSDIDHSMWRTRAWTLEEALMSRNLLFVGRNVYLTSDMLLRSPYSSNYLKSLCDIRYQWNSCMLLWDIAQRTSTKMHDIFFALANIRPDLMDETDSFDYQQDLNDLAMRFFARLARRDLTLLCFGLRQGYRLRPLEEANTIRANQESTPSTQSVNSIHLPSWTGWISGASHIEPTNAMMVGTNFDGEYLFTEGGVMHLSCECISVTIGENLVDDISIERISSTTTFGIPLNGQVNPGMQPIAGNYQSIDFYEPSGTPHQRPAFVDTPDPNGLVFVDTPGWFTKVGPTPSDYRLQQTHVLRLQEYGEIWVNTNLQSAETIGAYLSLLEDCKSCVILYGLSFTTKDLSWRFYPVVIQEDDHYYRSIGLCLMFDKLVFVNDNVQIETLDINIK